MELVSLNAGRRRGLGTAPSAATLFHGLVRRLDLALRHFQGIQEFNEKPDCLLRIAPRRASANVHLADGVDLADGDEILELHFWNEHLTPVPGADAGFGRGVLLRHQFASSLAQLAACVESEPSYACVTALRARIAFVSRRRLAKLLRVAHAYGLDMASSSERRPLTARVHDFCESLLACALTWTFNPRALRRSGLVRQRCELWISRTALLARYGHRGPGTLPKPLVRLVAVTPVDDPFPALWPSAARAGSVVAPCQSPSARRFGIVVGARSR